MGQMEWVESVVLVSEYGFLLFDAKTHRMVVGT